MELENQSFSHNEVETIQSEFQIRKFEIQRLGGWGVEGS